MVGIAGKSQGCATCRSRKIRCDQQRPQCGNCLKSHRECGGYERWPTFINRTPQGLQRRKRLEEVKHAAATDSSSSDEPTSTVVSNDRATPQSIQRSLQNPDDLMKWYHASLLARNDTQASYFTASIMSLSTPGPMLTSSMRALCLVGYGKHVKDKTLLAQGRRLYGNSLKKLSSALNDSVSNRSDETLASAVALGLFELLHGTATLDAPSWQVHQDGIALMLAHRGSKGLQSPLSLAIFEGFRERFLITDLKRGREPLFASREWIENPWESKEKDSQQKVNDLGFRLVRLQRQTYALAQQPSPDSVEMKTAIQELKDLFNCANVYHKDCPLCEKRTVELSEVNGMMPYPPLGFSEWRAGYLNVENIDPMHCIMYKVIQFFSLTATDKIHSLQRIKDPMQPCHSITQNDRLIRYRLSYDILDLAAFHAKRSHRAGAFVRLAWIINSVVQHMDPSDPGADRCTDLVQEFLSAAQQINMKQEYEMEAIV